MQLKRQVQVIDANREEFKFKIQEITKTGAATEEWMVPT